MIKKITQTAVINIVFKRIFMRNETSSSHKNAFEYNVYHRCLCYFLNPVNLATVSVRSDGDREDSARTEELTKPSTCCSWIVDLCMATTLDGRLLIASKLIA